MKKQTVALLILRILIFTTIGCTKKACPTYGDRTSSGLYSK